MIFDILYIYMVIKLGNFEYEQLLEVIKNIILKNNIEAVGCYT
ncbi:hypothetical protein [Clostridium tarantellae]|nr:hypothetical protein [Clostridium tarantellae]